MKIFSSHQIRQITQAAINAGSTTLVEIIDRMSESAAYEIMTRFRQSKQIVVFAGAETTGAYAIATAIKLIEQGYMPLVIVFDVSETMSAECKVQINRLNDLNPDCLTVISRHMAFNPPDLSRNDVVIDGLFGAELTSPLLGESGFPMLVGYINNSGAFVVSFDLPSGMMSEWNRECLYRNMVHSNVTLAAHFPRLAYFLPDSARAVGEWKLVDLDINSAISNTTITDFHYLETPDAIRHLVGRDQFTDKHDYGSVLLVSGSYGMMGASVLAARSAMRSGAGRVTVHAPLCGCTILQTAAPEALFDADKNDVVITDMSAKGRFNVIAVGPGIGTNPATISALEALLRTSTVHVILDADALNCIAARPQMLNDIKPLSIITPHAAEFDRLFGASQSAEARFIKAIEMARHYRIFIILKGHYTAIIRPDGKVFFNTTGNAGMATAGSGDVLTGIIAGFIAQGLKPERAAILGVYVHGFAGDLAAERQGEHALIASDIVANLGRAISNLLSQKINASI